MKKIFVIQHKADKWDLQGQKRNPNMQIFAISQSGTGLHFKQRLYKNYLLSQINQNNTLLCKDKLPSLKKVMYFEPQPDMIYGTDIFCEKRG